MNSSQNDKNFEEDFYQVNEQELHLMVVKEIIKEQLNIDIEAEAGKRKQEFKRSCQEIFTQLGFTDFKEDSITPDYEETKKYLLKKKYPELYSNLKQKWKAKWQKKKEGIISITENGKKIMSIKIN